MTYDYAAKGRADALAGLRDDKLYNLMEPHGEAYRNAHRLARIGAGAPAQASAAVAPPPSDEPPWANEAPPRAKDEPAQAAPPAVAIVAEPPPAASDETSLFAPSNEVGKLNIGDNSPPHSPPPEPLKLAPVPPDMPIEPAPEAPPAPDSGAEDPMQLSLLDGDPDWKKVWAGMPAFEQRDESPWQTVQVHFRNRADRVAFAKLIGQTITDDTRSIWYPKAEIRRYVDKRYATEEAVNPRFPVYVISKGRWETRLTADALAKIGIPFRIVVEPQEAEKYAAAIPREKILVLPFSNLGLGSIPARNWVWEHAVASGAERHWILDDNIDGFYRLNDNLKVPCTSGATFRAAEDFVDRYENVALAGFQYFMFASRKTVIPPFALNTRIYSCILINHALDLPERWRGRYNEDTDLSIRALKAGWCSVLFNAFLAYKITTMKMGGGNTDELYKIKEGEKDGRRLMAESLQAQHPELVKIVWKWGRWQHSVDYSVFRRNELKPRASAAIPEGENNYGMKFEQLSDEEMAARDAT